ncbi:hypothetical protein [Nonomuraea sp. SYSU D8015]|uniref:hypothetical protein n=1 Tax=Nonomuraea sp. SYSU D8015 TaxID=2593644 RepID=UPI00166144CD|nr:hypothetical protein [Nonomuraea sp. SYSU D8015]
MTVTPGATLSVPAMTMVVTPTASGTIGLKGEGFTLQVNGATYTCTPGASGGPSVNLVVGSATNTATTTPTNTNTNTATPTNTTTSSTPRPTRTSTATVTVTPSESRRNSRTPKAGADTGAGGEMGPDGRMFILTGAALIAAATVGGLVMRRRNATRG